MTWKEIIKAPKKLTHSQSKHLDLNNDGKISREDFDLLNKKEKNLMKDIKKKILSAKTKQGGALAMKDLKHRWRFLHA